MRDAAPRARSYRDLRRFLLCVLFYQAGVTAVIALAAIYAEQVMGFTTQHTIMLILVVNVTAAIGAFGFGYVQDAIGHVRAVALTLVGWIVDGADRLLRRRRRRSFWVAANLAGPVHGLVPVGRARASSATSRRRRARPSSSGCGASR